jgi:pilus assembly protein CpaC
MNVTNGTTQVRTLLMALLISLGMGSALPAAAASVSPPAEVISVPMNSHKLLRLPANIGRVAIGEPKIADVNVVNSRELLLLGKSQGTTSLLVWPRAGTKKKGGDIEPKEFIVNVGSYAAGVEDAELGQIKVLPGSAIDGSTPNLLAHQRAALAAASFDGKSKVADRSVVNLDTQVMSEVKVVEVERTTSQQYGLNLFKTSANTVAGYSVPGSVSSGGPGSTSLGSSTGFTPIANAFNIIVGNPQQGLLGILSLLENKGLAKTLAEPSLTASSGQTATFLAGGEFPIPVPQGGGTNGSTTVTIQFKEFGVRLNLTPTVLTASRISLKVAPEVSELDYSNGISINGFIVPGLIVRRTDTMVELGDGETFVISGLVSNTMKGNVDKVPFLGDLPVIGAFFKSNTFSRDEKELIMVVTPHLVRPLVRGAKLPQLPGAGIEDYRPNFAETMFLENGKFGQGDYGYSH